MAWLNQFTLVMRSSITALREKVEDPERMLHQLIVDMEEELESVRSGVAEAIADEIQLRKRVESERKQIDEWLSRAEKAAKRGDREGAKSALDQKLLAEERVESLDEEYEKQKSQTRRLQDSVRDLEDKIRQARQKRTLLVARLNRSQSSRRINEALNRAESRSAFAQFSRLEGRVERSEALEEAYDRMDGRDPDAEELERKFDEDERKNRVREEFDQLMERLNQDS